MKSLIKKFKHIFLLALIIVCSVGGSTHVLFATSVDEPFIVGMECSYAPYNWTSPKKTPTSVEIGAGQNCDGFDVMIARKIADGLGRRLVIRKIAWDGLIPSLQSRQITAIIAGMAPTAERKQEIAFSDTYYNGTFGVIVNTTGPYTNAQNKFDFQDADITAQLGTVHAQLISQLYGAKELPPMKDFPTMTVAAKSKQIDGFVADFATGTTIVQQNSDLKFILLDGQEGFQTSADATGVAVGVRKDDLQLVNQINMILGTMTEQDREVYMSEAIATQPGAESSESGTSFFGQIGRLWSQYSSMFIAGMLTTLFISIVSTFLGILLGLLTTILRNSSKIGKFLVTIYVTVIRGTPMMVQSMLIFYGTALAFPGFQWSKVPFGNILAGLIIVTINTGAYMAETIRSGIQALDDGQFEAAKSLGFTPWQTMTSIILPQAIRNVLPALGNEFIVNIKDTSVLNVIGVSELFFTSSSVSGATYQFFQTFTITAIIYLILTTVFSILLNYVEKRFGTPQNR